MTRPAASTPRACDEYGFTLVEMLVSIVAGIAVILATFSILDVSLHQSTRIADRVSADQRGRLAMEKIMLELHSSCVEASLTPIRTGSEPLSISFISQTGSQASFENVTRHEITFSAKEGTLVDKSYKSVAGSSAAKPEFPSSPTSAQTLLTNVSQTTASAETLPIFSYYKYEKGEISTARLPTPLSALNAEAAAEVTVAFTVGPESGDTQTSRAVELSNTAVLRFDPATATGRDEPCT